MSDLSGQIAAFLEPAWRNSQSGPATIDKDALKEGSLFIAARVLDFINHVSCHLRDLAGFAMVGVLAMMLAVSAYPFRQHDTLLLISWVVLLTAVATGVIVFVQINRSRIISMLQGTDPGHFNWNSTFVVQVLVFGVIPILTVIGAQFPFRVGALFSWFGGILGTR